MPLQPNHLFEVPTAFHIMVRVLIYTAGTLLTTLGGYHGYRSYRGVPFEREDANAELLRDEIVFEEDFAKLKLRRDIDSPTAAEAKGVFLHDPPRRQAPKDRAKSTNPLSPVPLARSEI
jgi:hypothetical protein